jgi:predicted RNA polymerase sigma factor
LAEERHVSHEGAFRTSACGWARRGGGRQALLVAWPQILALYELLERAAPNPVVTLNRAVAVAMVRGPQAGLALLTTLDDELGQHHRLHAIRAHLLELAGDAVAAHDSYLTAARRTTSLPEQRYLEARAAKLHDSP